MLGMRDSEIAVRIVDTQAVDTIMNGQPWRAGRFAHELRMCVERPAPTSIRVLPTISRPPPVLTTHPSSSHTRAHRSLFREHLGVVDNDAALVDPALDTSYLDMWLRRAQRNTRLYREVFHCIPDDTVSTWAEYRRFLAYPAPERAKALEILADVRGHVVLFPTHFLRATALLDISIGASENLVPNEVFL